MKLAGSRALAPCSFSLILLVGLSGCGLIVRTPSASSEELVPTYQSSGKALCADGYAPISLLSGGTPLRSIDDLPAGSFAYLSSEFYVEQRLSGARSQIHVSHGEAKPKGYVECVTYRTDSPAIQWSAGIPWTVVKTAGQPASVATWWGLSAEVHTAKSSWAYRYFSEGADAAPRGTPFWFRMSETEYQLRTLADDGWVLANYKFVPAPKAAANAPAHHAGGSRTAPRPPARPAPAPTPRAPTGFQSLALGKYRFAGAYTFYSGVIQGEKIELDFVEQPGSADPKLTRSVGLSTGYGFYAELTSVYEIEKTGASAASFTLRDYHLSTQGLGDYSYRSSNRALIQRSNVHAFSDLGFDLGLEAVPGHPNQVILTRTMNRDGMFFQVRVILQRE